MIGVRKFERFEEMVIHTLSAVFAILLYLQAKHFVCDYPLQTQYMVANKGTYGHPGILHAAIHTFFTLPVFVIVPASFTVAAGVAVSEFLLHYHIDYISST